MRPGLPILVLAVAAVLATGCPRRPEPAACERACAHLADLLRAERAERGLDAPDGLVPAHPTGRANVAECGRTCAEEGRAEELECLLAAESVDAWIRCTTDLPRR